MYKKLNERLQEIEEALLLPKRVYNVIQSSPLQT